MPQKGILDAQAPENARYGVGQGLWHTEEAQCLSIIGHMSTESSRATAVENALSGMGEGVGGINVCLQNSNTIQPFISVSSLTR